MTSGRGSSESVRDAPGRSTFVIASCLASNSNLDCHFLDRRSLNTFGYDKTENITIIIVRDSILISSILYRKLKPTTMALRRTLVRLAESVSARPLNLQQASAALLPPVPYVKISQSIYIS